MPANATATSASAKTSVAPATNQSAAPIRRLGGSGAATSTASPSAAVPSTPESCFVTIASDATMPAARYATSRRLRNAAPTSAVAPSSSATASDE